jgi:hypothetical protein
LNKRKLLRGRFSAPPPKPNAREGSHAGAQLVADEFELGAAERDARIVGGARDVAVVPARGFGDHAGFEFFDRLGKRRVIGQVEGRAGGGEGTREMADLKVAV